METVQIWGSGVRRRWNWKTVSVAVCSVAVMVGVYALVMAKFVSADTAETSFSLVQVPDTQQEVLPSGLTLLGDRYSWIGANKLSENIKFVAHSGDVVNWGVADPAQFTRASAATERLDASGIPYALAIGNHDSAAVKVGGSAADGNVHDNLRNTTAFNQTFPLSRFKNVGGTFEPNKVDNMYQTFTAGGADWLVLTHELWPRQSVLDWAKQVVESHPHHNVIINTHAYIDSGGVRPTSGSYGDKSAQAEWDQLISQYANIKMVLCAHYSGTYYSVATGVHGNKIAQVMTAYHSSYQNHVRKLAINTENNTLKSSVFVPNSTNAAYPSGTITGTYADFTVDGMQWVRPVVTTPPSDTAAPSVALTAPTVGQVGRGITPVVADASDNVGVSKVAFYVDNQKVGEDTTAPYTYDWDTTASAAKSYTLTATAYDAAGNSTVSTAHIVALTDGTLDTTAPSVALTAPAPNAVTSQKMVTIVADASDNVGVSKVAFYVDNQKVGEDTTAPYTYDWDTTALADKQYSLMAIAYDAAGNLGWTALQNVTLDAVFTLAVAADTKQEVSASTIAQLNARYQWLVDNKSALDLRFFVHSGNLVNGGVADRAQFDRASGATTILGTAKLPYAEAVGVHDSAAVTATGAAAAGSASTNLRNTTVFNQYFPATRFANIAGRFESNKADNQYQKFSAGGVDWLVLNLEPWPRTAAITWAKSVVAANPKVNVIINTSVFLSSDGSRSTSASFGSTSPATLWSQLVSQYPNIKLVTSGYNTGSLQAKATGVNGNTVSQVLTSYKSNTENHVRLLEINTKTGTIQSRVYVSRDTRGYAPHYLTDAGATFQVSGLQWVR